MRSLIFIAICSLLAGLWGSVATVSAGNNHAGAWVLHYAGPHDAEANTCALEITDCMYEVEGDAPSGPGRFDIYVLALYVFDVAETSFGLSCDAPFYFYGWTSCADSETPTAGWPGCGEANTLAWTSGQWGPYVTMGILDVYAYGGDSVMCMSPDPRLGYGEWCDSSAPEPVCDRISHPAYFGCVGFGYPGYDACPFPLPTETHTWGAIKALYR